MIRMLRLFSSDSSVRVTSSICFLSCIVCKSVFDIRAFNEDDTRVTIRLSERAGWVAEHYPVDIIDVTDDVSTIRMSVSDPAVAARLLLRLGDAAELVDGFKVAETVAELRNRILERYLR